MQPPTAAPRTNLTFDQVLTLVATSHELVVNYGAHVLDRSLNYVTDLTPYLSNAKSRPEVDRDNYATVHGTCSLNMDLNAPLNYMNQLVRPYMTLTAEALITGTFYLGVYTMQTPQTRDMSSSVPSSTITGYDLLWFLNQPVLSSKMVAAGSNPVTAAVGVIQTAMSPATPTINYVPTSSTLSADMVWPIDQSNQTTWLTIVNQLLNAAGYQGVWVDWAGAFQLLPYLAPRDRLAEFTFTVGDQYNSVADQRDVVQDIWGVPNQWRFVMNGLTTSPVEGTSQYTYTDYAVGNPGSVMNRGFLVPKPIQYVDAADYNALVTTASKTISADMSPGEVLDQQMAPFPLAWHFDQAIIVDDALAGLAPLYSRTRRVQAKSWRMPLDGSDTSYVWETVQ